MIGRVGAFLCLCALEVMAQAASPVTEENVYNVPSYVISNDKLELAVAARGGALRRLILKEDPERLSPFGNPEKLASQPAPGRGPSLLGHFVCVDGFGPVSSEESKAGLGAHGEARALPWEIVSSSRQAKTATVTFSVRLPIVQEDFRRAFTMVEGENVIYVDSELENLLGFDRPVNWAEHPTIASPFLEPEKNVVDISSVRSRTRSYQEGAAAARRRLVSFQDFTWPLAPARQGPPIDLRGVPTSPDSLDHITTLMDPARKLAWVTALNTSRRYLVGYVFRSSESAWLQQWMSYAASGWLQRGLEFASQPFDLPRREVITTGAMFGTPTYRWLPAKSKISSRFLIFYTRTPAGMSRVDDVRVEGGKIIVEDRGSGRQVVLTASVAL